MKTAGATFTVKASVSQRIGNVILDALPIAAQRLGRDAVVNPTAPKVLKLTRPISKDAAQNAAVQALIARLQKAGAEDIRVNQQQVNLAEKRVGIDRPDLQYTLGDERHYVEWDKPKCSDPTTSARGFAHSDRLLANDPDAVIHLIILASGKDCD